MRLSTIVIFERFTNHHRTHVFDDHVPVSADVSYEGDAYRVDFAPDTCLLNQLEVDQAEAALIRLFDAATLPSGMWVAA